MWGNLKAVGLKAFQKTFKITNTEIVKIIKLDYKKQVLEHSRKWNAKWFMAERISLDLNKNA